MTTTATQVKPTAHHRPKSDAQRKLEAEHKRATNQLILHWAKEFRIGHCRTVEAIVKHGAKLNEGKRALGHGNWLDALTKAGFQERTAQEYMRIAKHPVLSNPKNFALLPSAVSTLYLLSGLQKEFVQDLLDEERITRNTTKDELVQILEPSPASPAKRPTPKKGGAIKSFTWPTSVDASVKSFFGGAFDCDTTFPGEAVWRNDEEAISFLAEPTMESVEFHNRVLSGEMALFPLGQRFAMFYTGERRDQFAAEFGYLGTLVVVWGG